MMGMDDQAALQELSAFVNNNYDLIRDLRENALIHEKFASKIGKMHDIMLDLMFALNKPQGGGDDKF